MPSTDIKEAGQDQVCLQPSVRGKRQADRKSLLASQLSLANTVSRKFSERPSWNAIRQRMIEKYLMFSSGLHIRRYPCTTFPYTAIKKEQ